MVNDLNIGGVFIPGLLAGLHAGTHRAFIAQQALPSFAFSPAAGRFNLSGHLFPADAGPDRAGVI